MRLNREHQDQRERHGVKDFQSPGWYAVLRFWQIKIMNWGRYQRIILRILTHGSRCVVSAWIPVSNYLSASAHWCHSFPVITQSPACQGQVTSRWAWLVLNWALSSILSHRDTAVSHQPADTTYQPMASPSPHSKLWLVSNLRCWDLITSDSTLHVRMCHFFFFFHSVSSSLQKIN